MIKEVRKMTKKERAAKIAETLKTAYPDAGCTLTYSTPLEMLIATQLSAQCTDARVNTVTPVLFEKYPDAQSFACADYDELCGIIRPLGFYHSKAKNIILCCRRIIDEYSGEVPGTMDELLTLPGTGRKTANLILGEIFGKSAVVTDTHCMRLSRRTGLTSNSTPEKIEADLRKTVAPGEQLGLCHRFVYHGRLVCTARSPKCGECVIAGLCKSYPYKPE